MKFHLDIWKYLIVRSSSLLINFSRKVTPLFKCMLLTLIRKSRVASTMPKQFPKSPSDPSLTYIAIATDLVCTKVASDVGNI